MGNAFHFPAESPRDFMSPNAMAKLNLHDSFNIACRFFIRSNQPPHWMVFFACRADIIPAMFCAPSGGGRFCHEWEPVKNKCNLTTPPLSLKIQKWNPLAAVRNGTSVCISTGIAEKLYPADEQPPRARCPRRMIKSLSFSPTA